MADASDDKATFVPVAEVTVDLVRPTREGFTLEGRGEDGADYRMDMHLDIRVNERTRTVLGEIFSQSEWSIARRVRSPLRARLQRNRSADRSTS